jgi:hypothetical protein
MIAQFSEIRHVNERFLQLIDSMASNPYEPATYGDRTVIDVVGRIKAEFGERGARSVRVTFH